MSSEPNMNGMEPEIDQWINQLQNKEKREEALRELVARQSDTPDLAIILWKNNATKFVFLQEIISLFSTINPDDITNEQSGRICLTLQLLRTVAEHHETRLNFIKARFPLYLYLFLNTIWTTAAFVRARDISLTTLASLAASYDKEILAFLLRTNLPTLLIRIIKVCKGFSRNSAIMTLHQILASNEGLAYVVGKENLGVEIYSVLNGLLATMSPSLAAVYIKRCLERLTEKNI